MAAAPACEEYVSPDVPTHNHDKHLVRNNSSACMHSDEGEQFAKLRLLMSCDKMLLRVATYKQEEHTYISLIQLGITAFTSYRTNLSPFTKGCREWDAAM